MILHTHIGSERLHGLIWLQPRLPAPGMVTVGMATWFNGYCQEDLQKAPAPSLLQCSWCCEHDDRQNWFCLWRDTSALVSCMSPAGKLALSNNAACHPHKTGHPAGKSSRTEDMQGT